MKLYTETTLDAVTYWGGAGDTYMELTEPELEVVEEFLEDAYPEGMHEYDLNDFMWFERDFIADLLGYEDWEDLEDHHTERWAN